MVKHQASLRLTNFITAECAGGLKGSGSNLGRHYACVRVDRPELANWCVVSYAPAGQVAAVGGKGVAGAIGARKLFLGWPSAAEGLARLNDEATSEITALQEQGKTVSVLMTVGVVSGLIAVRD